MAPQREFSNLVDLLQSSVQTYGPRPLFGVLRDGAVDWTTFAGFGALVDRFRAGLAQLGIGRGDRVGVISNNRLEWAVGAHACFGLGAAYVPMYEAQRPEEWRYILGDSGCVACFAGTAKIADQLSALRAELPSLQHVVSFDEADSTPHTYDTLLAAGERKPLEASQPAPEEVATLIYTSGTTGDPKGVVLTHNNLAGAVNSLMAIVEVGSEDCGIAFLPWAHVFGGCVEMNLGLATGAATAICGDASRLSEYFPVVKPTVLFAVPRVWHGLYDGVMAKMAAAPKPAQDLFHAALEAKKKLRYGQDITAAEQAAIDAAEQSIFPMVRANMGGRLRFAVSGAAALAREVGEFMMSLGIAVHEGYGLTETCGAATAQPPNAVRLGSVGVALPGVRFELDKSVESAGEDEGELIIYGTNVMRGYHKRDDANKQALTPDGGLRTGDLARIDADGYVYITGRVKDLYKLENGKYVAPEPIERILQQSPYISQAVVMGQDKPHNVALIIANMPAVRTWCQGQSITGSDAELLTEPKVAALFEREVQKSNMKCKGYERIQDFILDSDELTKENGLLTQTLKLKRRAISAKYGAEIEALYPQAESERAAPRASYIRELREISKSG